MKYIIDDLVFFCHNHNIGLKVTLNYALRMFMAYNRKYSRIFKAFDKVNIKGKGTGKGDFTPKEKTPAEWFMEERK